MAKYDLTNFFQSAKKPAQNSENSKAVVSGWKFEAPAGGKKEEAPQIQEQKAEAPESAKVQEEKIESPKQEQQSLAIEQPQIFPHT